MTTAPRSEDWQDIDATADPSTLSKYLNAVTALEAVKAYKRKSFQMLDPHEGDQILDVGCGNGDDVLELAQMVGPTGKVFGIDSSTTLIEEARRKLTQTNLSAHFEVGNALNLEFADSTYDGCRSDRVFQHLDDPVNALAEMVRVTRSGGRVCVGDTDWGTIVIDMPDVELTTRMLPHWSQRHRNGWSGRQLLRLCHDAGLEDISVIYATGLFRDFAVADHILYLSACVAELEQKGTISSEEGTRWLAYLKEADRLGCFFATLSGFTVVGRKP